MAVRLRQLARQGKLLANDQVRKGRSGDWVEAASVEMLELSSSANPSLPPLETRQLPEVKPNPSPPKSDHLSVGAKFREMYGRFTEAISDGTDSILSTFRTLRPVMTVVCLIAVTVALVIKLINDFKIDWSPPPDALAIYNSLWEELKQKRSDGATESEWDEFTKRGRAQLATTITWLEKRAVRSNPESQILLRAGRECLPKMLEDSRITRSRTETQFQRFLTNVEQLRKGQPLNQRADAPEAARAQHQASFTIEKITYVCFFILDIGLCMAFVTFWLRKKVNKEGINSTS